MLLRLCLLPVFLLSLALTAARADDATTLVPQTWQMLDYMATDYGGAVENGQVISVPEYAEQQEFSRTAKQHIAALPATPAKAALLADADRFIQLIDDKAAVDTVANQAHKLADALIAAYSMPTAPAATPDLARGKALYDAQCAACHGVSGDGKGPAAAGLEPPPIDFTDRARADLRSPLSYFQTISQGVEGTSMTAFGQQLTEADRWALAYFVSSLPYRDEAAKGEKLWQENAAARASISNLDELSRLRVDALVGLPDTDTARALAGYLRAHPAALEQALSGIPLARGRLAASVKAYLADNPKSAVALALSAYLDGIEPVEPLLNTHNSALRAQIELAMGAYRTSLARKADKQEVTDQAARIDRMLAEAETLTRAEATGATATFIGAFTILLREGLEALLVVIGLIAFLKKAERKESLPWVHAGWLLALLTGGLTWFVARYFIEISGASRELTEGLSSLFAAIVLLCVGLWMHQKSMGDRWQAYIKEKMSHALSQRSAWLLFILSFVTVYREIFETILFYVALWSDGMGLWMLLGVAAAVAVLAVIAWVMLATSRRLPLSTFFSASSALIAVLCVVLVGKGVSALQEAGWVGVTLANVPHIDLLGIFPTWQTTLSQLAMLAVLVIGYLWNKRSGRTA